MPTHLPALEPLYKELCSWNFYTDIVDDRGQADTNNEAVGSAQTNTTSLRPVPLRFESLEDYNDIFFPLFLRECRAQCVRSRAIERSEPETCLLQQCDLTADFVFFHFQRTATAERRFLHNDFVLVSKDQPDVVQDVHVLAVVEQSSSQALILRTCLQLQQQDPRSLQVANQLTENSPWYVSKICSLSTINREYQALRSLPTLLLRDHILHPDQMYSVTGGHLHVPPLLHAKLSKMYNDSQQKAMKAALRKRGLTLIQGPPGTGKTTTIIGVLSVLLHATSRKTAAPSDGIDGSKSSLDRRDAAWTVSMPWLTKSAYTPWYDELDLTEDMMGKSHNPYNPDTNVICLARSEIDAKPPSRVLVCAPSNAAIDEIVRRLIAGGIYDSMGESFKPRVVRVGPNYHPSLESVSLEKLVEERLRGRGEDANMLRDHTKLKILEEASIVCSTLSVAGSTTFAQLPTGFDTVVIDEASQGVELSTLIPLKYGCERLILVGDPRQLPATVFSKVAEDHNYDQSLFKRCQLSDVPVQLLTTQYRMHPAISHFPSKHFYNSQLLDAPQILDLIGQPPFYAYGIFGPFAFLDVVEGSEQSLSNSVFNQHEVDVVMALYSTLRRKYPDIQWENRCAVVSPYSQQVAAIQRAFKALYNLPPHAACPVEVNSVDGFQGREKDFVIFSTVRAESESGHIGFLADTRRMNVGLTRAREAMIVIGHAKQLRVNVHWRGLVSYARRSGTMFSMREPYEACLLSHLGRGPSNWKMAQTLDDAEGMEEVQDDETDEDDEPILDESAKPPSRKRVKANTAVSKETTAATASTTTRNVRKKKTVQNELTQ